MQMTIFGNPKLSFCLFLTPHIAGCGLPPSPTNGYVDDFESSEEGAELVYECNPGLLPTGRNISTCIAGDWVPDPAALLCSCPGQFTRQLASIPMHICIMILLLGEM